MATDRRRQLLLAGLLVILAVVGYRAWGPTSDAPAQTSNQSGPAGSSSPRPAGAGAGRASAPDVHLESLSAERPKPATRDRNLFRFRPKAPPPPPPQMQPPVVAPPVEAGPPPPPPVPQIPLKFIGTVERGGQKMAVLSDSAGHVSYGPEGATIDGRYRIVRIGAESIEMVYVDGRGRQTIRMTGG